MSMTTKQNLSLILQVMKKLLSFKADKEEVATKIDKSEVEDIDAIELMAETNIVQPVADENNAVFLDENNAIYVL